METKEKTKKIKNPIKKEKSKKPKAKKIELNIFEKLNLKNLTYAVVISQSDFKSTGLGIIGKDHFIILHQNDRKKAFGLKFHRFEDKLPIIERDLTEAEIEIFKKLSDDFVKVKHDADGRVYELKHDSFKEKYFPD